ncbi:MAG: DUF6092 family protein [Candidatus Dormibacteraceae bacterium]
MAQHLVVNERDAFDLLAHLVASAEICTFEPHYYGTFRLIDAASRLAGSMLKTADPDDQWLREFKREIDQKKVSMMWDREGYYQFLREVPAKVAQEMKRRDAETSGEARGKTRTPPDVS